MMHLFYYCLNVLNEYGNFETSLKSPLGQLMNEIGDYILEQ